MCHDKFSVASQALKQTTKVEYKTPYYSLLRASTRCLVVMITVWDVRWDTVG